MHIFYTLLVLCTGNSPAISGLQTKKPIMQSFCGFCVISAEKFWINSRVPREMRHHDDVIKCKHFPRYWPFVRWRVISPHKGPVMRSFDVFFDLRPNKRLSKQLWGWRFETPSHPLWRHSNAFMLWRHPYADCLQISVLKTDINDNNHKVETERA